MLLPVRGLFPPGTGLALRKTRPAPGPRPALTDSEPPPFKVEVQARKLTGPGGAWVPAPGGWQVP
jgi:hypothetical protein